MAAVGVKPPALYHHFGSREGLVIAAQVERYRKQLVAEVARQLRPFGEPGWIRTDIDLDACCRLFFGHPAG